MSVALVAIVRDEAAVIGRMLNSCRHEIDTYCIVDTGSSDDTPAAIERCLSAMPGRLCARPWINFGHNRSESLELACKMADWLLVLDADEELIGPLPALDPAATSYDLTVREGGTAWRSKRLLRANLGWRYEGAAHAVPASTLPDDNSQTTNSAWIEHHNDGGCKHGRRERNIELLSQHDDPRSVFYLAQEYLDAGRLGDALRTYRRRSMMDGWIQERFYALYQFGRLFPPPCVDELQRAHEMMPERLEPVHALTQAYRERGMRQTAMVWARYGVERAWPIPHDGLFVQEWIYRWGMRFEYAVTAQQLGEFEEAARIWRALGHLPLPNGYRAAVERNLALMS